MKRLFAWQATAAFVLVLGIVSFGTRLVSQVLPGPLWDPGFRHPATLSPDMQQWIQDLQSPLTVTLFLTSDEQMPAHMKSVGPATRQLLAAMEKAGKGLVLTRVIDPDLSGDAGARYAARSRVSPVQVRQIREDESRQTTIWSSLVLSQPGHPDVLIQDIGPQHLPHLQSWILTHLRRTTPRAPRFAIDVPDGYHQLAGHLAQLGPVLDIDFDTRGHLPPDIDLFFWVQPDRVTAQHIAQLRSLLASGRSVVLAGSPYQLAFEDTTHFHAVSQGPAWNTLLRSFGLRATPDLLMDRNSGPVFVAAGGRLSEVRAPFHLRNLPAFRDFRPLPVQARGGLAFAGAGALQIDTSRLQASGWTAHVAATTTQHAWVTDLPSESTSLETLTEGLPVPKQNLMILLRSPDPWAGQMMVLAAPTPFADASLSQAGYGHAIFVRDLVRALAHPDQLVRIDVDRRLAPALPPTGSMERVAWRVVLIAGLPLIWLGVAVRRLQYLDTVRWPQWRALPGAWVPLVLATVASLAGHLHRPRLDLTAERIHSITDTTQRALQSIPGLEMEWIVSPPSQLPPRMKRVAAQVEDALSQTGIPWRRHLLSPAMTPRQRQQWMQSGIRPFPVAHVAHDTSRVERITAGLILRSQDAQTAIPRLDERSLPHLDFLLVAATERLRRGHAPRLTVVSDLPRLSPAEALEDYQKKGLSAPRGVDVYHEAKQLLSDYGYQIQHVSLRNPEFPPSSDAVLWFQPRRDAMAITESLSHHLAGGRPAIVALQHFNIQQRQYRGAGFSTVYWPQPQFQDLQTYLRLLGVEQPREILMDRAQHALRLATQVNRSAVREYDEQQVALPFLLRTVTAQHNAHDLLSRHLGDQLFIWGNRFTLMDGASSVRRADTLITTTDHAWAFDWHGGWLPPEAFEPEHSLPGPQPLVLRLSGPFPGVTATRDSSGQRHLQPTEPGQASTQLLLIGSSEMFKDPYLFKTPFAHDQLLLNAVAEAVYGERLLRLQARSSNTHRGFLPPDERVRMGWRLAVIGWGPLTLGLLGALRWQQRHRRQGPGAMA